MARAILVHPETVKVMYFAWNIQEPRRPGKGYVCSKLVDIICWTEIFKETMMSATGMIICKDFFVIFLGPHVARLDSWCTEVLGRNYQRVKLKCELLMSVIIWFLCRCSLGHYLTLLQALVCVVFYLPFDRTAVMFGLQVGLHKIFLQLVAISFFLQFCNVI